MLSFSQTYQHQAVTGIGFCGFWKCAPHFLHLHQSEA